MNITLNNYKSNIENIFLKHIKFIHYTAYSAFKRSFTSMFTQMSL